MSALGPVFADTIQKTGKRKNIFAESSGESKFYRFYFFLIAFFIGFALLILRLFTLTVVEGQQYKKLSSENRIREINLPAPRGIIYDRNKIPLVRNIPIYKTVDGEIFFSKQNNFNEHYTESSTREYIYGDVFGNLLGFIGEVNENDLKKLVPNTALPKNMPFKLQDFTGKTGIEQSYDTSLRGADGAEMYETDATGKYIRTLGRKDPISGENLVLNVDLAMQKKAAELLKDKTGAIVVSDPKSGEILALYSSPSFDPNKILKSEDLASVFNNPEQPMFDRAISGTYPPGSTFKIITSIAALETGAISKNTTFEDTGILHVGTEFSFGNWYFLQYGRTEGQVNIIKAIQRSNDIFFYKTAEATGIEKIAQWAKTMGLGKTLGIDINGEEKGLMPDPVWKQNVKKENWYLGDTYHVAIGQGDILATPLQVNSFTNIIANDGELCKPKLAKSQKTSCKKLPISRENIELVRDGMIKACQEGGTGWPLFNFKVQNPNIKIDNLNFSEAQASGSANMTGVTIACKTGTAEFGDLANKTHAWFTVFAPAFDPQITVTILIEKGGEGSTVAGPLAREMLKTWFER